MQTMLKFDNETRTSNKPSRFLKASDYANWQFHFENYIASTDPELLVYLTKKYEAPLNENGGGNKPFELYTPEENKDYEKERKIYASNTMCLTRDTLFLFKKKATTYDLWE